MKNIWIVMGTRPEIIKLVPLIKELKSQDCFCVTVCFTGQHQELAEKTMASFGIVPDIRFDICKENQTLSVSASKLLSLIGNTVKKELCDCMVVQGDTLTAFAASLAAFYQNIPVAHVEAGLRTYDLASPFPEEMHRQVISKLAVFHFAPTEVAKQALLREGIEPSRVFNVGNTVVDTLRESSTLTPTVRFNIPAEKHLILFTVHRREQFGKALKGMLKALSEIAKAHPECEFVFPIHPNPNVRLPAEEMLGGRNNIRLISPPDAVSFHHLLRQCALILTDSGGIQEEAVSLGIPTLVMRERTERTEGISSGNLRLIGTEESMIFHTVDTILREKYIFTKKRCPSSVFGDGHASQRIAAILKTNLSAFS